jgi:hypothetical protein
MNSYFPPLRFPAMVPEDKIRRILENLFEQNIIERIEVVGDKQIVYLLQTPFYTVGINRVLNLIEKEGSITLKCQCQSVCPFTHGIEVGYAENNSISIRNYAPYWPVTVPVTVPVTAPAKAPRRSFFSWLRR